LAPYHCTNGPFPPSEFKTCRATTLWACSDGCSSFHLNIHQLLHVVACIAFRISPQVRVPNGGWLSLANQCIVPVGVLASLYHSVDIVSRANEIILGIIVHVLEQPVRIEYAYYTCEKNETRRHCDINGHLPKRAPGNRPGAIYLVRRAWSSLPARTNSAIKILHSVWLCGQFQYLVSYPSGAYIGSSHIGVI
jgi:hypothetical protein